MKQAVKVTEAEAELQRLHNEIAELRQRNAELRDDSRKHYNELIDKSRKLDDLHVKVMGLNGEIASLNRQVGTLEGYRMRVERVDDLDRGIKPAAGDTDSFRHVGFDYGKPR